MMRDLLIAALFITLPYMVFLYIGISMGML